MDYYDLMIRFKPLLILVALLGAMAANAQSSTTADEPSPSSAMDGELFYQLLIGELNARGGEPGAGFALILDAARKTNDPRLFQRAVDIALQSRSGDSALMAARAWRQAIPASREANRFVLQILIGLNRLNETLEPLKREIASYEPKERAAGIANLPRYFARATDKKLAASVVEQALADHLNAPGVQVTAWTTLGVMRTAANDLNGAVEAARKALALDPKAETPALLVLSLMSPSLPQAEALVKKYLEGKASPEVRMEYARQLLGTQRYAESDTQLQLVTSDKPDLADAWLLRGVLELQDNKLATAERSLKRYLELVLPKRNAANRAETSRSLAQAYLSLAQIAEQRKDWVEADSWLKRIDSAEDRLATQMRRATLLARQGKTDEARKLIRSQAEKSPAEARLKLSTEVQVLRENKQYKTAYDLLTDAASRTPNDMDLVYDLAMVAEKMGNLEDMERLLKKVIAAKPDYQHAYNALGFSLAERNVRLPEARQLIVKALELAPNDPFITDSLGWVEFRSGNLAEALKILQGAYKARPDAEIAAHLGEVLWAMGKRDQAVLIWKEGVKLNSDNETLLETLKRLQVKL
jgi:tetratricopeptide (TPR) repeat protein